MSTSNDPAPAQAAGVTGSRAEGTANAAAAGSSAAPPPIPNGPPAGANAAPATADAVGDLDLSQ